MNNDIFKIIKKYWRHPDHIEHSKKYQHIMKLINVGGQAYKEYSKDFERHYPGFYITFSRYFLVHIKIFTWRILNRLHYQVLLDYQV